MSILDEIHEAYTVWYEQEYPNARPLKRSATEDMLMDGWQSALPDYKAIDTYSDEIGEQCYSIFQWKGKYYKMPYSYKSHYGSEYHGCEIREVTPEQRTITVYN